MADPARDTALSELVARVRGLTGGPVGPQDLRRVADKIAEAVEGFGAAFYNQSRNDNASSAQIDFASALLSACVEFASVIRKASHNG